MSDASGNSGRQLSQKPMAQYMRDRTKAKRVGLTVKQWKTYGMPETEGELRIAQQNEANRVVPAEPQSCDSGLPGES